MPEDSSQSLAVYQTRQQVDEFEITQTPLGVGNSVQSNTKHSAGHNVVRILARANVGSPGTIEVWQSPKDPFSGFELTASKVTAPDPATGEEAVFLSAKIYGEYTRIIYVNGGVVQTVFQLSAYLVPVGG